MASETVKVTMEIKPRYADAILGEMTASVVLDTSDDAITHTVEISMTYARISDALDAIAMLSDLLERMRK